MSSIVYDAHGCGIDTHLHIDQADDIVRYCNGYADLVAALTDAKRRMRNCRGAIESNQVVDKDVHGGLTRGMEAIDAALAKAVQS
jgi:hypothetical protein